MQPLLAVDSCAESRAGPGASRQSSTWWLPRGSGQVLVAKLVKRAAVLLLSIMAGCATRAPHIAVMGPDGNLPDGTCSRLIGVWQQQLARYVVDEGSGDPAIVSQMRVLHSRDILRPARITFGVLDVEATTPAKDGWDIQGVLIGKQMYGESNWYVFLVGIVARTGYRPSSIVDIRLVGLWARAGKLAWEMSPAAPLALQRYRDTYRESVPVRFPENTDQFSMSATDDRVSVRELRSRADWSLRLNAGKADTGGQTAIRVRS